MLKYSFFILTWLLFLTACGTQKSADKVEGQVTSSNEVMQDEDQSPDQDVANNSIGKVVLSDEGCQLKLVLENDEACYYPVNLDDKFKVDGAYLQFQKYPSRAPLPSGCESCRTIQVANVVRLKR